jgi:hypothetical protein
LGGALAEGVAVFVDLADEEALLELVLDEELVAEPVAEAVLLLVSELVAEAVPVPVRLFIVEPVADPEDDDEAEQVAELLPLPEAEAKLEYDRLFDSVKYDVPVAEIVTSLSLFVGEADVVGLITGGSILKVAEADAVPVEDLVEEGEPERVCV